MTKPLSTRNLDGMLPPPELWKRSVALAALDAVLSPEWEFRYYSFAPTWGPGTQMASMRNGSGDDYSIGFSPQGVFVKGFDHEAPMSPWRPGKPGLWPGTYAGCPPGLEQFRDEPSFKPADTTFAFWWDSATQAWGKGPTEFPPGDDPDGSIWLLEILGGGPERYVAFAAAYYELEVPRVLVEQVYAHAPLSRSFVVDLNPATEEPDAVLEEIASFDYGGRYPF